MATKDNSELTAPVDKVFFKRKVYLVAYNSILVVTWTLVLLKTLVYISEKKSFYGLYDDIKFWLKLSQAAAILEIIHSVIGIVQSSALNTIPQVFSRLFTLFVVVDGILMKHDEGKDTTGFPLLLFAWTITEIVRYSFYTNSLLDNGGPILVWCRYSFFIVLYPIGVLGEVICIIASLPLARKTGVFSITLPNAWNFSIDYVFTCYAIMLIYVPAFYHLYTHM